MIYYQHVLYTELSLLSLLSALFSWQHRGSGRQSLSKCAGVPRGESGGEMPQHGNRRRVRGCGLAAGPPACSLP